MNINCGSLLPYVIKSSIDAYHTVEQKELSYVVYALGGHDVTFSVTAVNNASLSSPTSKITIRTAELRKFYFINL